MKRFIIILCIFLTFNYNSISQIILTEANITFGPQTYVLVSAGVAGVTVPAEGNNQNWNYSNLGVIGINADNYVTPPTNSIAGATFADTAIDVTFFSSATYYKDDYWTKDAASTRILGSVIKKQSYNISSLTGGANDSCKIPAQVIMYNNPIKIINYPATMNSKWISNYIDKIDFILNIPSYFINNANCYKISHITVKDSVVGWGSMVIPTLLGPSQPYNVLMVKQNLVAVDSFYINNAPASPFVLSLFGLSQGQQHVDNRYIFWRENSAIPLLEFRFANDNYTSPAEIYFDGQIATNIDENNTPAQNENTQILIYPNPASEKVSVKGCYNSKIQVYDLTGKELYSCLSDSYVHDIFLNDFISGTYLIKITNNDNNVLSKLFNVIKH